MHKNCEEDFHGFEVPPGRYFLKAEKADELRRLVSESRAQPDHWKPVGLWYSLRGDWDWLDWVKDEMPIWYNNYRLLYQIEIVKKEVLHIASPEQLHEFDKEFRNEYGSINWRAVSEQYGGIEIAPYQHILRLDDRVPWYYPWDCASGCIWHHRAVRNIKLLHESNHESAEVVDCCVTCNTPAYVPKNVIRNYVICPSCSKT